MTSLKKIPGLALRTLVLSALPVIAIVFTIMIFRNKVESEANLIEITFDDASGVQPEKTPVRFRGVEIGVAKSVTVPEDNSAVVVSVALKPTAAHFAVQGSKFWIVRPKVSFQGITGIETLIEGSYIAVKPGPSNSETKKTFNGSPSSDSAENFIAIILTTPRADSLSEGDGIFFRGIRIGQISKVNLTQDTQFTELHGQVYRQYGKLLRSNALFARKVAVQAKLGLFNSEIKIGSLDSLMNGGIEVYIPDTPGPQLKPPYRFTLQDTIPKDADKWSASL